MSDQKQQKQPLTTTSFGSPAPSDEYSLTVGPGGPNLLQDSYLIEKLAHFVRERIPDRVYHVKGGGAFGYFEVTADVSQWTKAAFLNKLGKLTPLFLRFSIVAADEGAPDTTDECGSEQRLLAAPPRVGQDATLNGATSEWKKLMTKPGPGNERHVLSKGRKTVIP